MEINKNFKLRDIKGHYLLVPIRTNSISNDVIALNDTAGLLFKNCMYEDENDIVSAVLKNFSNTTNEDRKMLLEYLEMMITNGLIVRK
ncbi:PqqD family peptide modification chaperone [uncultured Phascolarctobacterium sp.]|uniref:PqqD family peptide modification chaperone n=1 Tax=Phascolarctobacterium sp. TaxID=2049039 RepID=UPI0026045EBF|nr:PqqD family peptide modification chaperone [uncultured Phascolarctobacterium sp.]